MSETQKIAYRVRNWSQYNQALINRGSITLWFDEEAITSWVNTEKSGRRGRDRTYTDTAIECMLLVQSVFHLTLRQTQGFIGSLITLLALGLPVANYTTLCRRRKDLSVKLPRQQNRKGIHVVVDSTGLKVFGYGEWFLAKYRPKAEQKERKNPRLWRKIHLGVDEATGELLAVVTTVKNTHDKTQLPDVLDQIDTELDQVSADKGYDYMTCHDVIVGRGARPVIPPRKNARIWDNGQMETRDAIIRRIQVVGRKAWKVEASYHRRSLAEVAVFRLKNTFGPKLRSRLLENQRVEVRLRCKALNQMTHLGMPDAYPVSLAT